MVRVCPNSRRWHAIYEHLLAVCAKRKIATPPPMPLILGAWWATNDVQKADRWTLTVKWAERHGVVDLVAVEPDDWYSVEQPSSEYVEPL